ncbi:energy-coupling factor ABC transporter permease [Aestuariirhabdus sp. Z084]|uniref:energy-coupling factor ABC transporter permease n=1 Tax=Aestuariirhabdus haliotis TaxID=2918751 RepID=UPI00201B40FF|nr:energy-coupling factor ABC transporter permease [Aestuariirhabdus haliotis]MCL6415488.1 energy-coupling factor ABC transporter permease [Aestuariirhabdus haliotis]MCL6419307.1 energy-coupling factor ABC transporter permease [Aestuariirhabdus haliotis]
MHIEPGFVAPVKVIAANVITVSLLVFYVRQYLFSLSSLAVQIPRMLLAAGFFSLFMQSYSVPVGPSELHFVGAMAIYLTLGFIPTLIGFAFGLLMQGLLFDPGDLAHLAINSLSLMLPLISVHFLAGRHYLSGERTTSITQIVKLDAIYYSGVTGMVGFWLAISDVATPLNAWMSFAASYLIIVMLEPLVSIAAVKLLKAFDHSPLIKRFFSVQKLQLNKPV